MKGQRLRECTNDKLGISNGQLKRIMAVDRGAERRSGDIRLVVL